MIKRWFGTLWSWLFPQPIAPSKAPKPKVESDRGIRYRVSDRDDLLDQLHWSQNLVKRMKRFDPPAYKLYRRLGCRVVTERQVVWRADDAADRAQINPIVAAPSFGCVFWPSQDHDDNNFLSLKMAYFNALKRSPASIQPTNGRVFELVCVFHASNDAFFKHGMPYHFYISLLGDTVTVLKERKTRYIHNPSNSRSDRIPQTAWAIPRHIKKWTDDSRFDQVDQLAAFIFRIMCTTLLEPAGGVQVRATQKGVTSLFRLHEAAAKKLFADRERIEARDGKAKRIWHYNQGWTDKNGKQVPGHWKGLRDFQWQGYRIHIRFDATQDKTTEVVHGLDALQFDDDEVLPSERLVSTVDVGKTVKTVAEARSIKQINKSL